MTKVIPGIVHHQPHKFNPSITRNYKVCPKTLEKLKKSLQGHENDDKWSASNIGAPNCAEWASARLTDAGLDSGNLFDNMSFLDPKTLNPPPPDFKKYNIPLGF